MQSAAAKAAAWFVSWRTFLWNKNRIIKNRWEANYLLDKEHRLLRIDKDLKDKRKVVYLFGYDDTIDEDIKYFSENIKK